MRSYAGELLMADIQLGPLPVPSAQNPSDDPSRRRHVRRHPVAGAPAWASEFVAGNVTQVDRVLPRDGRGRWLLPVHATPHAAESDEWRTAPQTWPDDALVWRVENALYRKCRWGPRGLAGPDQRRVRKARHAAGKLQSKDGCAM